MSAPVHDEARPGNDSLGLSAADARRDTTRRGLALMARGAREQRRMFTVAFIGALVYGALTVADAWVLGWATDEVITPAFDDGDVPQATAVGAALLFVSVALLRAGGVIARRLAGGVVYYRLMAAYRRDVTRRYLELPVSWHRRHPTGQLLSNANADVEASWAAMMPLPMALGVIAMLVVAIGAMLMADWVLTLVGLIVFPLLFLVNIGYQRRLSPRATRAQELRASVSSVAHESFEGALVVKSLGREADETARFAHVTDELRDANIAVGRIRSVFDPVIEALPNVGILAVVLIGVERVLSGATDPGAVVQVAYLFVVVGFPVRAFGWVLGEIPRSVVGWERVRSVLDAEGETAYGDVELPGSAAVSLRIEGLRLVHGDRPVLDGIDLDLAPGRVLAVVGRTGSGKSTLASLLARLVDPDDGRILLDDVPATDLTHDSLARTIALVPQQTFVFDDTVRENITLGLDVPDDEIWEVLRAVQAHEVVAALPAGLETRLGERGTSLSGGQRQRIALARALVRRPRLLVMDDATSALDPDVEQRILRALAARTRDGDGPTVVVVAYRKASIGLADEVVYLADGRIRDRGTHAELFTRDHAYRDLVDAYDQARGATP